jgi:hypothetical protein
LKLRLFHIFNNWPALEKVATLDLPAKKAYALARFIKHARAEYELVDQARVKLVEKYGTKDDKGNVQVSSDRLNEFVTEFDELLQAEVEIYDPGLTVDDLDGAKLSAAAFFGLSWLFDREEPVKGD